MKKIWLALLGLFVFGVTLVFAPIVHEYVMTQTATGVEKTVSLRYYMDGTEFYNGSQLAWGLVNVSETYYYNLTVVNVGNLNTKVYVLIKNLPVGWTESWTANNTVLAPNQWVDGDFDLYCGSTGTYIWNWTIRAEEI